MSNRSAPEVLVVASRQEGEGGGLWRFDRDGDRLVARDRTPVADLRVLASHPRLPVVYSLVGYPSAAAVAAWRFGRGEVAELISQRALSGGEPEPCHLALSPAGEHLVVSQYETGVLEVWSVDQAGLIGERFGRFELRGASVDEDRQASAHPHQAIFPAAAERELVVSDLGSDRLRRLAIVPEAGGLTEVASSRLPAGTGPRHMVELPGGRLAVSGELSSSIVVGDVDEGRWLGAPSTTRRGPASQRSARNYPGDIAFSPAQGVVYLANRGHDTIAVVDVSQGAPVVIDEVDAPGWPQHMHVAGDVLVVACQDASMLLTYRHAGRSLDPDYTVVNVSSPVWVSPLVEG